MWGSCITCRQNCNLVTVSIWKRSMPSRADWMPTDKGWMFDGYPWWSVWLDLKPTKSKPQKTPVRDFLDQIIWRGDWSYIWAEPFGCSPDQREKEEGGFTFCLLAFTLAGSLYHVGGKSVSCWCDIPSLILELASLASNIDGRPAALQENPQSFSAILGPLGHPASD